MESIEFPHIPLHPTSHIASPTINTLHQNGAFVTINQPTWTYNHHPKFKVSIGFILGVKYSKGFNKCIMSGIRHY